MAAARDRPLWLPLHLNRLPDGLLRLITFIRLRNSQAFVHSLVLFMLFPVINLKFWRIIILARANGRLGLRMRERLVQMLEHANLKILHVFLELQRSLQGPLVHIVHFDHAAVNDLIVHFVYCLDLLVQKIVQFLQNDSHGLLDTRIYLLTHNLIVIF